MGGFPVSLKQEKHLISVKLKRPRPLIVTIKPWITKQSWQSNHNVFLIIIVVSRPRFKAVRQSFSIQHAQLCCRCWFLRTYAWPELSTILVNSYRYTVVSTYLNFNREIRFLFSSNSLPTVNHTVLWMVIVEILYVLFFVRS